MAKKNTKNTATVKVIRMTKKGYPTIELFQNGSGQNVDVVISGMTFSVDVASANDLYVDRLENGYKVAPQKDQKVAAPKEPTAKPKKVEKTAEEKKAEREQKLTEKYGDIETRRAYIQKRQTIWAEESAKIAEAVKNGEMKRLRKDEWKALMNERVNARLSA